MTPPCSWEHTCLPFGLRVTWRAGRSCSRTGSINIVARTLSRPIFFLPAVGLETPRGQERLCPAVSQPPRFRRRESLSEGASWDQLYLVHLLAPQGPGAAGVKGQL